MKKEQTLDKYRIFRCISRICDKSTPCFLAKKMQVLEYPCISPYKDWPVSGHEKQHVEWYVRFNFLLFFICV